MPRVWLRAFDGGQLPPSLCECMHVASRWISVYRVFFGETGGRRRLVSPGVAAGALTMPGLLLSCYPRHWLAMLVEMMSVELSWSEVMHRHSTRYHANGHRSAFQVELCV